jgi:drug/metabolite transporter (DMT)-like permease
VSLKNHNTAGFFHLMVIYIVWGSTYLAIRLTVRDGAGFTPFMMAGSRAIVAGLILLVGAILSKQPLRISFRAFIPLALSALMLWLGGNGLVTWGSQFVDSALIALIIAGVPFWAAGIEAVVDRRLPSLQLMAALLVGTAGIAVLSFPALRDGTRSDLIALGAIVGASLTWAAGTLIQSRRRPPVSLVVSSAYSMLVAAVGFGVLALLNNEPIPTPSTEAWLAWGYLVIFGSILGFTSYSQALRLLPAQVVTTSSYVNPIVAVFLGWLVLREEITAWTVGGAALVLLGVTGVFRENARQRQLKRFSTENERLIKSTPDKHTTEPYA